MSPLGALVRKGNKISKLKSYYMLTKPGIIRGNLMTALGAYFYASKGNFDWMILLGVTLGVGLIIASACVFNNYIDRGIDSKMARTQKRAIVTGEVSGQFAMTYASLLGVLGIVVLLLWTNPLTLLIGLVAHFLYVVVYGYFKRQSPFGTIVGTLPGAASITAGYTAVTGQIDGAALMLFLILVVWQLPHFYAIALFRKAEYAAAKIPVLPIVKGDKETIQRIIAFISILMLLIFSFSLLGFAGITFGVILGTLCAYWLFHALQGIEAKDTPRWAKKIFGISLLVLPTLSLLLALDHWLP